jgi:hypothetical protein
MPIAAPKLFSGPLRRMGFRKLRTGRIIFFLLFIALSPALTAQQQPEPKPLRFDFTPFIGYRTSMSLPIEPHVSGTNPSVVLDANPSFGVSFGFRLNEDGLVEIRWARQDSYVHSQDVNPPIPRQRVILHQFHGDFSREYTVEEWGPWARPFVLLSVGGTQISNSNDVNFTRFSFGIGGGVRFYPSRHIGFKIQAEWVPVLVDPQGAFICGAGCIVHVGGTASSQGEVLVGPTVRF